jgi:WD40 repeat protein
VIVWNVERRRPVGTPLTDRRGQSIRSVAFDPNLTTAALGFFNGTIAVWDLSRRQLVGAAFQAHSRLVSTMAFSHDGALLASASTDGTIRLWDVSVESSKRRACGIANRDLRRDEWDQFVGSGRPYRRTCTKLRSDATPSS